MDDEAVLRMLFEEHQRQLAEELRKIHTLTERTVALLLLLTGWLVVSENAPAGYLKTILVIAVTSVTVGACGLQLVYHNGYWRIASVVSALNQAFGLHESGRHLPDRALYPDAWRGFGSRRRVGNLLLHMGVVGVVGGLCVAAALAR